MNMAAGSTVEFGSHVPAQQPSPSPAFQTASLCTSSASSEPYVSPRDSESVDATGDEAPAQRQHSSVSVSSKETGEATRWHDQPAGASNGAATATGCTKASPRITSSTPATSTPAQVPNLTERTAPRVSCSAAGAQLPPPPPHTHFQYIHSFDYRSRLAAKMRNLYGIEFIPVIVEPAESHLRPASPASAAYESKRLAAETRYRGAELGRGLLTRLGIQDTSPSRGAAAAGTAGGASCSPPLSASAVAALSSPSTRSTVKCILPSAKSVAEIILTLRDRLALDSCQSIFLSVGESDALVPGNSLLGDLYQRYHHPDGFLYLSYLLENTFG